MHTPEYPHKFKGPIEGYVVNHLTRDYWKFEASFTRLDMLQEAWVVFDRVARTYPAVEPRHFMALFKTAWSRRTIELARVTTKHRLRQESAVEADAADSVIGELDNEGYLRVLIGQMPSELQTVVKLFLNAPDELLDVIRASWRRPATKAVANEMVNRCLGFEAGRTPLNDVEDYLKK